MTISNEKFYSNIINLISLAIVSVFVIEIVISSSQYNISYFSLGAILSIACPLFIISYLKVDFLSYIKIGCFLFGLSAILVVLFTNSIPLFFHTSTGISLSSSYSGFAIGTGILFFVCFILRNKKT